jgi:hypothetical protein
VQKNFSNDRIEPALFTNAKRFEFAAPLASYWINRKNCCVPEMGLVTVFCPLTTTGAAELVVQTGEARFVVNCRVYPV